MRRISRNSFLAVAGLAVAAAAYAYFSDPMGAAPRYRIAHVERGPLTVAINAVGTVNAVKLVHVGAEISGQIRELSADFNSTVREGQVIARIAPENFAAKVDQAKAELEMASARVLSAGVRLERAKAELVRIRAQDQVYRAHVQGAKVVAEQAGRDLARKLAQKRKGFVSQSEFEQAQLARDKAVAELSAATAEQRVHGAVIGSAETDVKAAEVEVRVAEAGHRQALAALRQAEADLKRTRITSPIDGIVIERSVDVGQTVASSLQTPNLFAIAQSLKDLQVETYIDETDIGHVRVGQDASFTVGAFPGVTFSGKVVQIRQAPLVVQNVVTYMVIVSARNDDLKLLPGMTATVRIVSDRIADARLVPAAALRFSPPDAPAGPVAAVGNHPGKGAPPPHRTGRVYTVAADGTLTPISLKLGASDGTKTQIVDGPVKVGDPVVVGVRRESPVGGRTLRLPWR